MELSELLVTVSFDPQLSPLPVEDGNYFFHSFSARKEDAAAVPEISGPYSLWMGWPLLWCQSPSATPQRPGCQAGVLTSAINPSQARQSHPVALGGHWIA